MITSTTHFILYYFFIIIWIIKRIHIRGPSAHPEGESSSTGAPNGNSPEETVQETLVLQDQQQLERGNPTAGNGDQGNRTATSTESDDPMEVDENQMNPSNQITETSKNLTSDNRAFLLQKMKELRSELFDCTASGMDSPNSAEEKCFDDATQKLERLKKGFKLLSDDEEVLVLGEAPYFQWSGIIFDESKAHSNNVEDCLERFERVLTAYRVDIEDNWKRILPARLVVGAVARRYAGLNDIATWSQFKDLLIQKYSRRQADIKEEARENLEHLSFREAQNFNKFIEEFQELQVAADIKDEDCLVWYLFKALPEDLANSTKFYINNATNNGEITIKFAIEKVVATYDARFKSKWTRGAARLENAVADYNGDFFRGNTQDSQRDDGSNSRGNYKDGYKRKSQGFYNGQTSHKSSRLECKYHLGLTNHSEVDCVLPAEIKKSMEKAYKKYGREVKFCNRCNAANYKEGHNCKPKDLAKLKKNIKVITEKKKTIVPVISDDDSEDGHDWWIRVK